MLIWDITIDIPLTRLAMAQATTKMSQLFQKDAKAELD